MHSFCLLVGLLTFNIQRSSASFSLGGSNGLFTTTFVGDSQPESEEAPALIHAPVMYSAPLVASMPVSPVVHYDVLKPQRSEVRNLVGSYAREEGHLSDTTLELPFRRARARKLAARKAARMHKKSLRKHRKVNKQ
ncbi:hypothetical protein Y032_0049g1844 [Ancylostoma ceylanicum]|uniref:Mitochondrial mRNA-processing protein COX24 C-terminal domain-containing protein n=1 Tax=Ancylostoma ceylanicum TaxID=53326 RepID=A0A016UAN5_9BILA|nr:hypothetical protein Y032_0049g1844 [Ancylostoma ceylanicum]